MKVKHGTPRYLAGYGLLLSLVSQEIALKHQFQNSYDVSHEIDDLHENSTYHLLQCVYLFVILQTFAKTTHN